MGSIARALAVYVFLLLVFRIAGRRALSEATTFDLVLTLIISESIQQALIDSDNSLTNAFLLVVTLLGTNVALALVKQRWPAVEKVLEGTPVVVFDRGKLVRESMQRERVDEEELLQAAREQGLERLDQVKYAVVEVDGGITIIPKDEAR